MLAFRGEQRALEIAGFGEPSLGFSRALESGGKHARVGKKPRVHGAFGQRLLHVRPRLVGAAGGRERPCQRVMGENVLAVLQFALRQINSRFSLLAARGQEQRESPRIALRAELLQVRLDICGFVGTARRAERVGQRPLKFRQRIELRRALRGATASSKELASSNMRLRSKRAAG